MSSTDGRRLVTWATPSFSADGLKNFACVMMLLYSVGVIVIERGLIHIDQYTQQELSDALSADSRLMNYAGWGSVLELMVGMALPLFAFLLVEGFFNTSSFSKYFARIGILALISEIPYDLAMRGKLFDFYSQNPVFSMAVCLVMLYCLRICRRLKGFAAVLGQVLTVIGALLWVMLLRADFGLVIVLLVADFYIFYARNVIKTILGILISLMYVTGPLSFYGVWCYTGERKDRIPKYVYYAFYPAHLLALWLLTRFLPA